MFRLLAMGACLLGLWIGRLPAAATPAPRVLILHDSSGPSGWVGGLHGRMLANLLGHFQLEHDLRPVESYTAGLLPAYHATFYLGTVFDNPLPESFLADVAESQRPFCWFRYNLWQLDAALSGGLTNRFGFRFGFMDLSGFSEVHYKGETLIKDLRDPDVGRTAVTDPQRVEVPATAWNPATSSSIPYVLRSGSFWYVADSPFTYLTEEDRYLVLADLLHDILEVPHPESHPALIRLEDITPDYDGARLRQAVDLLDEESVPFTVAVIPVLEDPLGIFSQGQPRRIPLTDAPSLLQALQYALGRGGQILLHGYTHQYRDLPNPVSGLSGDDYEFFRVETDGEGGLVTFQAVPEDSTAWVSERLDRAEQELARNGLSAVGWVTPHYTASALGYAVMAERFPRSMEHGLYFDQEGNWVSQFFPYPIHGDAYGQTVYPENLGHVSAAPDGRGVEDLLRAARKTRVVRDGWAGTFFHPFLDLEDLRALVRGLKDLGFQFVPLTVEEPPSICEQPLHRHQSLGGAVELSVTVCGAQPVWIQWFRDGQPVPGATNATLTLPSLDAANAGHYTAGVSNAHGGVLSRPIPVRLLHPPLITGQGTTNGAFHLAFHGETGLLYFAEYRDFLQATSWTRTFPVIGEGRATHLEAPLGGLNRRFYRLRVE